MVQIFKKESASDMNLDPFLDNDEPLSFTSHRRETGVRPPRTPTIPRGITLPRNMVFLHRSSQDLTSQDPTSQSFHQLQGEHINERMVRSGGNFNSIPHSNTMMKNFKQNLKLSDRADIPRETPNAKIFSATSSDDDQFEHSATTQANSMSNVTQEMKARRRMKMFQSLRSPQTCDRMRGVKNRMRRVVGRSKDLERMNQSRD